MQVNLFPEEQKTIFEKEREMEISNENQRSREEISRLQKEVPQSAPKLDPAGDFFSGICMGLAFGFFPCICVLSSAGMGAGFWTWVICALIGGFIVMSRGKASYESLGYKIEANKRAQENERKRLERKIEEINSTYKKKYEDYLKTFEFTAQQNSVKFAESKLAKEVIEWMTEGFSKTIDATDRRSHIERINVPFAFNVYTDKITCNLGTYDFEIKRCSNLTSPIEQTALARAIASAIQLNIVMKYPQDESGTSISIDIDYNYSAESPTTTVTYVAPNGNYRVVEKW